MYIMDAAHMTHEHKTQILVEERSNFAKYVDIFGKISKLVMNIISFYKVSCIEVVSIHSLSLSGHSGWCHWK